MRTYHKHAGYSGVAEGGLGAAIDAFAGKLGDVNLPSLMSLVTDGAKYVARTGVLLGAVAAQALGCAGPLRLGDVDHGYLETVASSADAKTLTDVSEGMGQATEVPDDLQIRYDLSRAAALGLSGDDKSTLERLAGAQAEMHALVENTGNGGCNALPHLIADYAWQITNGARKDGAERNYDTAIAASARRAMARLHNKLALVGYSSGNNNDVGGIENKLASLRSALAENEGEATERRGAKAYLNTLLEDFNRQGTVIARMIRIFDAIGRNIPYEEQSQRGIYNMLHRAIVGYDPTEKAKEFLKSGRYEVRIDPDGTDYDVRKSTEGLRREVRLLRDNRRVTADVADAVFRYLDLKEQDVFALAPEPGLMKWWNMLPFSKLLSIRQASGYMGVEAATPMELLKLVKALEEGATDDQVNWRVNGEQTAILVHTLLSAVSVGGLVAGIATAAAGGAAASALAPSGAASGGQAAATFAPAFVIP